MKSGRNIGLSYFRILEGDMGKGMSIVQHNLDFLLTRIVIPKNFLMAAACLISRNSG
jgi:hypothetical protein